MRILLLSALLFSTACTSSWTALGLGEGTTMTVIDEEGAARIANWPGATKRQIKGNAGGVHSYLDGFGLTLGGVYTDREEDLGMEVRWDDGTRQTTTWMTGCTGGDQLYIEVTSFEDDPHWYSAAVASDLCQGAPSGTLHTTMYHCPINEYGLPDCGQVDRELSLELSWSFDEELEIRSFGGGAYPVPAGY